jgi:hypothetical protein
MILRIILILLSFDCVLVLFPQTNPIGGITLLLGDLLNFVVSNKKLSIMNKFVEFTVDGEKCIINASVVQLVNFKMELKSIRDLAFRNCQIFF